MFLHYGVNTLIDIKTYRPLPFYDWLSKYVLNTNRSLINIIALYRTNQMPDLGVTIGYSSSYCRGKVRTFLEKPILFRERLSGISMAS